MNRRTGFLLLVPLCLACARHVHAKGRLHPFVEAMYLRPTDGMPPYALKDRKPGTSGEFVHSIPGFGPGLKVGANYNFDKERDLRISASYLRAEDNSSLTASAGQTIGATLYDGLAAPPFIDATEAVAKSEFVSKVLDLEAGYSKVVSDRVHFRPFAGLRYAYLRRTLNVKYSGFLFPETGQTNDSLSRFSGAGARLGLEASYSLTKQLSLNGELAGAILIGESLRKRNSSAGSPRVENLRQTVPMAEMFFGLEWGERNSPLSMRLGYRLEHWSGAIGTPLAIDSSLVEGSRTDLTLDGLVLQAMLTF